MASKNTQVSRRKILISLFVAIFGLGLLYYLQDLIVMAVKTQVKLREGVEDQFYEQWIKFPIPIRYNYYFFNIENPREALRGAKPRVREVGPFCFDQWRHKKILGWGNNGETVKYLEYKNNLFISDDGGCKNNLDMKITVVNPPIAALGSTIAEMVKEKVPLAGVTSPVIYSTISALLAAHSQNLFMTRTVREIIYGFRINLLDTVTTLIKPLEMMGFKDLLPGGGVPNNTFGLLYGKNNTPEGPYEVYTGINNKPYIGLFKFKNQKSLKFWDAEYCNQLKGTDGSVFGPGVKRTDKLWAFAADLCRSLYLEYERDSEYMGIPTYRFGMGKKLFSTPENEPKNECFCIHQKRRDRCAINGIYDLGGCNFGAPIIISPPHFYGTEPDLSEHIIGLNPNKKDHGSYADIEPITGGGLRGKKALQFAFRVENVPFLRGFDRIRNVTIPFAWAQETGELPEDMANEVKMMLFTPVKYIRYVLAGVGTLGAILFAYYLFRKMCSGNSSDKLNPESIRDYARRRLSNTRLYRKRRVADSADASSVGSRATSETVLVDANTLQSSRRKTRSVKGRPNDSQLLVRRLSGSRFVQPFVLGQPAPTMLQPPMLTSPSFPILAIQMPPNSQNQAASLYPLNATFGSNYRAVQLAPSTSTNGSSQISVRQLTATVLPSLPSNAVTYPSYSGRSTPATISPQSPLPPPPPSLPPPPPPPMPSNLMAAAYMIPTTNASLLTQPTNANSRKNSVRSNQQSAKKSLKFTDDLNNASESAEVSQIEQQQAMEGRTEASKEKEDKSESEAEADADLEQVEQDEEMRNYFYGGDDLSDSFSTIDEMNEQMLEEDRRRLKQLGLE